MCSDRETASPSSSSSSWPVIVAVLHIVLIVKLQLKDHK